LARSRASLVRARIMRYYEPIICNKKGEQFQPSNFGANF